MNYTICTLFEKHYHLGVAALINSLYINGYRGSIYAGYRGSLPSWTCFAEENSSLNWPGSRTLNSAEDIQIHFLPLDTSNHLTNYKPDLMLRLLSGPAVTADAIFYFDPDILVAASWSLFEEWIECGVALCEDVNSPLAVNHPRRVAWRKYFGEKGINLKFKDSIYVNGGFLGIHVKNKGFLEVWKSLQELMALQIGGLNKSIFSSERSLLNYKSPFAPFGKTDQDALNAAVEAWSGNVSFIGKEAMGFKSGTPFMSHAAGACKPWKWNPISQALKGNPPRRIDREYCTFANGVIVSRSSLQIKFHKLFINIALLVGRFYRRN